MKRSKRESSAELFNAIKHNQKEEVSGYIKDGGDLEVLGLSGVTPLLYSIAFAKTEVALKLIEGGADVNNPGAYGHSPLETAIFAGLKEVVLALIDKKAVYQAAKVYSSKLRSYEYISSEGEVEEADCEQTVDYIPEPEDLDFVAELSKRNLFLIDVERDHQIEVADLIISLDDVKICTYLSSVFDFSKIKGVSMGLPVGSAAMTDFLHKKGLKLHNILKGSVAHLDVLPGWPGIRQALNLDGDWRAIVNEERNFRQLLLNSQVEDMIDDAKGNSYSLMEACCTIMEKVSQVEQEHEKFFNGKVESYIPGNLKEFPAVYGQLSIELQSFQRMRAFSFPKRYQKTYAVNTLLQLASTCVSLRYVIQGVISLSEAQKQDGPLACMPVDILGKIGEFCIRDYPKLSHHHWGDLILITRKIATSNQPVPQSSAAHCI